MEKQEILYWSGRHDNQFPHGIKKEREIGGRLREKEELTKIDLFDIIEWKFEGLEGRKKRELDLMTDIDEQILKKVSNVVFNLNTSQDTYRIRLLCALRHGIGVAVASTILTFFDPKNYGVFDFHVWQEIFGEKLEGKYTVSNYVDLLSKLREIADKYDFDVRTVEKAFYKKNYDKSKQRK